MLFIIAAAIPLSGCINWDDISRLNPFSTPTPTPRPTLTPTIIPTPTKEPTITPPPGLMTKKSSNEVRIVYYEFNFDKKISGQSENITVLVANDGTKTAKNVILTLKIDDSQRGEMLVLKDYDIGDLERGERRFVSMLTPMHNYASSVFVQVNIEWGENREFYNPVTYIKKSFSVYV